MASYEDFVGSEDGTTPGLILDWANRDDDALPRAIRRDVLRWAADQCYSLLKVPPLELTRTFTITENDFAEDPAAFNGRELIMPVPTDLIQVVYIRSNRNSCVFEEKLDNRTFFQREAEKKSSAWWTRVGNNFHLQTIGYGLRVGDEITIHYYRRLPAMDARYRVTAASFNAQQMAGQLMVEEAVQDGSVGMPLYFVDPRGITIENFRNNFDIALVRDSSQHSDGSLWFNGASIDWPITAANYNVPEGNRIFQSIEVLSQGELWFGLETVTETAPRRSATSSRVDLSRFAIDPATGARGTQDSVVSVTRLFRGTETLLTKGTDWEVHENSVLGETEIMLHGTIVNDANYRIVYTARPLEPTGDAFDTETEGGVAAGVRTSFFFRGHTDFDLVDPAILTAQQLADTLVSATNSDYFNTQILFEVTGTFTPVPGTNTAFDSNTDPSTREAIYYTGNEIQHWLRDENERIVLFGALAEAFAYLQEDNMHQKYSQMFTDQIELINREETMRRALGGNVQINFNGRGLI